MILKKQNASNEDQTKRNKGNNKKSRRVRKL